MRKFVFDALTMALGVCAAFSCTSPDLSNGKKVYADYHGVRYTREHDGKLGRWEMYASTEKSATGRKSLCYNADLIDSLGHHQIAAVNYPLVGMQSNLDGDYLEYQILSAKTAGIDGFFVEWGFFPHENDVLLRAMQKVAARYGFEVGVNWCDGWLFYDWISRIYPEIDSRESKLEYMQKCYRYLVDSVYTVSTAAKVNGRPVFYHFGPGASADEYVEILSRLSREDPLFSPLTALRRWADWGTLEGDVYVPVTGSDDIDSWKCAGEVPAPWIPARVRTMDAEYPLWDNYATREDVVEFLKPFRDSVWLSSNPSFVLKSGFAMPGMDNRGCAGWGRSHFFCIPRDGGETYEAMWRFCLESKDSLDMMFIASWSDYTEGHEIEPTEENGYRELQTTLRYASEFKQTEPDTAGLGLPGRLFDCRKSALFLRKCGAGAQADEIEGLLDKAARQISEGKYRRAARCLDRSERALNRLTASVKAEKIVLDGLGREIRLDEALTSRLRGHHYTGTISFDYLDEGQEFLLVRSSTLKEPEEAFGVVGKLRTDGTGEWKRAKISLTDENITYIAGKPAFSFSGNVDVRGIVLEYNIYLM